MKKIKAIGMVSGGLDSSIASAMMFEQGIDVLGVNFSTGFCKSDHHRQINHPGRKKSSVRHEALRLAGDLSFPVKIMDISRDYISIILNPRYGYGKNINPCIDCRIFMLIQAKKYMEETGAGFVFTGEVVGQRPKSQRRHPLNIISRESGLNDRLLRPLSARLLPETYPEKMGWVTRDKLGDISGRSRRPQIELIKKYGINDYPQPAGGCCFLTEKAFSDRFTDLIQKPLPDMPPVPETMILLKVGRHFRISDSAKCIVGHDECENNFLNSIAGNRIKIKADMIASPVTIYTGIPEENDIITAARITARYSDAKNEKNVPVIICTPGSGERIITVTPMPPEETKKFLI